MTKKAGIHRAADLEQAIPKDLWLQIGLDAKVTFASLQRLRQEISTYSHPQDE